MALPNECIMHIFRYLNPFERLRQRRVSRQWYSVALDSYYWISATKMAKDGILTDPNSNLLSGSYVIIGSSDLNVQEKIYEMVPDELIEIHPIISFLYTILARYVNEISKDYETKAKRSCRIGIFNLTLGSYCSVIGTLNIAGGIGRSAVGKGQIDLDPKILQDVLQNSCMKEFIDNIRLNLNWQQCSRRLRSAEPMLDN